jgi:hypothetical protein
MQVNYALEIIEAISEQNPFTGCTVDKASTVWFSEYPDLAEYNQHVSQVLNDALKLLRNNVAESPVQTLLIVAPIGMGKTKVFSRIRRNFFERGKTLFSYINAGKLDDARFIYSWFRKGIVYDLSRVRPSGVSQWQEVASFLLSQATGKQTNAVTLAKNFDDAIAKSVAKGKNLFKSLTKKILGRYPRIDPYLVRSLLWTLSESYAPFALRWLAGEEIDQATADTMVLPSHLELSPEQREADSIQINPQILQLVNLYKPFIIGFDELEDSNFVSDDGFGKEQVLLNFIKKIYESVELVGTEDNGVLICSAIVKDLSFVGGTEQNSDLAGTPYRISTANNHQPITLQRLNPDLGVAMLELWLKERLYKPLDLTPPHALFPFEEAEVRKTCSIKPTPREFLKWCAEQYKELISKFVPPDEEKPDEEIFREALTKVRQTPIPPELLADSDQIGTLLRFGFMILDTLEEPIDAKTPNGEIISQLKIDGVNSDIPIINPGAQPKLNANDYLDFKLDGQDSNGKFCIGIGVSQAKHGLSIQAELKRLAAFERFGFTRACLVRSSNLPIRGQKNAELLEQLKSQGGEVVNFTPDELEPLWHLYSIVCKVDMGDIEFQERRIGDLIVEFELDTFLNNPILLEILSSVPDDQQTEVTDLDDDEGFELLVADSDDDDDDDDSAFDDLLAD